MDRALMSERMYRLFGSDEERVLAMKAYLGPKPKSKPEEETDVAVGPGDDEDEEPFDDDDDDEGDDDEDDGDDDSFDQGGSDDEDEDEEGDDESFAQAKVSVAKDPSAAISEDGRVVFVRDPENPERMYMVARVDNIAKDAGFDDTGKEMWVADIVFRLKGRGYSGPEQTIKGIDPDVFKKSNWSGRVEY
jgi:hypothetical protein